MKKTEKGLVVVSKDDMQAWAPALESYFGEQLKHISPERQKLLTAIAGKAYENAKGFIAASENVGFVQLNGNNSQVARDVANPSAGGHNGLVSEQGNSGSADPQFLTGLCLALAGKTIGLELVQAIPATSQNVTIDYLTAKYNGGDLDNPKQNKAYIVTVVFDGEVPVLAKNQKYAFRYLDGSTETLVLAKYHKQARENAKGLIFELENKVTATVGVGGALTSVVYVMDNILSTHIATSSLWTIDANISTIVRVQTPSAVDAVIDSADNTKAIENYVPNQTKNGLARKLSRKEADKGTDRGVSLDIRNENYVIGNSVFNGHIGRLQFKQLSEQGKAPLTFLSNAMLNEFAQEVNYQIVSAARAFGITNALNFQAMGTSFNTYFGPTTVLSKPFDSLVGADELVDKDNNDISGQFNALGNLRNVMQYETIESLGTAICMLIKQAAYAIGTDSRYGDGDAAVVSSNMAGYIAASSLFTPLKATGSVVMDGKTGAKLSGTIGDISVYVDVQMPISSSFITVLRTNKDVALDIPGFEEETLVIPGLAYLVKDLVSSVEIIPELTGGRKIIMDSETDLVAVGDNPEKAYLTFAVEIEIPGLTQLSA